MQGRQPRIRGVLLLSGGDCIVEDPDNCKCTLHSRYPHSHGMARACLSLRLLSYLVKLFDTLTTSTFDCRGAKVFELFEQPRVRCIQLTLVHHHQQRFNYFRHHLSLLQHHLHEMHASKHYHQGKQIDHYCLTEIHRHRCWFCFSLFQTWSNLPFSSFPP